jgi:seryl-tRNA synthetase
MLDFKQIRENSDFVEAQLARRHGDFSIVELKAVDVRQREAQSELEQLNRRKNEISELFKTGKASKEEMEKLRGETKEIKTRMEIVQPLAKDLEAERDQLAMSIPNLPDASVPEGKDEEGNQEIHRWGTIPDIKNPKAHYELGTELNVFDFERGVKISKSRLTVLMHWGARLERALMNFMLDSHAKRGYLEVFPPVMVNRNCLVGTGQLPKFEGDFFKLEEEDLYLIPTAEVPVTNLYRDEVLPEESLPILHCAYTPNFRREAGSAGKDTRGYIRQHQFNKVELVKFCTPETSAEEHEKLTRDAELILEALELPYRRMLLCAGDMGFCAQKCYDLEVWFPAQDKYREISSCSVFGEFQARRANLKYRTEGGARRFLHTINGSGLAIGRTLAAILENYQQEDGSVRIPEALRPYLGGATVIEPEQGKASALALNS